MSPTPTPDWEALYDVAFGGGTADKDHRGAAPAMA